MSLSPAEAEIFYDAVDDYYGLWEAVLGIRNVYPDRSEAEQRDIAECTLRGLLAKGWIALYKRTAFEPDATLLNPDEVEPALTDPRSWETPEVGTLEICFTSTEEGDVAYYKGELC